MMDLSGNNKAAYQTVFWTVLLCSTFLFAVKALIITDISLLDECHQIATSYRFWMGDAPLVDDWTPIQLHSIVLLPFVTVYMLVCHTTSGIVFFLRIVYLTLKLLIAVYAYRRLKNNPNQTAILCGIFIWYFFSPFNIDTLTYQEVPLMMMVLGFAIMMSGSIKSYDYTILGFLLAVCILSQPFFVLVYPLILLAAIMKIHETKQRSDSLKHLLYFHVGILIVFLPFCFLVFSRASVKELMVNTPYIFRDQDHNVNDSGITGLLYNNLYTTGKAMIKSGLITAFVNGAYILLLILAKTKRDLLKPGMLICLCISAVSIVASFPTFPMNFIFIPFAWFSIEILFFCENRLYPFLLVISFVYTASVALSTNTGALATSCGFCASAVLAFWNMDYENTVNHTLQAVCSCLILFLCIGLHLTFTWKREIISLDNYKFQIDEGPMKGLYADKQRYLDYYGIWDDVQDLRLTENDIIFSGTSSPLVYLNAQVKYGTMATGFFELPFHRVNDYYSLHPDRYPTVVYFNEKDIGVETLKKIDVLFDIEHVHHAKAGTVFWQQN